MCIIMAVAQGIWVLTYENHGPEFNLGPMQWTRPPPKL